MRSILSVVPATLVLLWSLESCGDGPADAPKTIMTVPGKLLFHEEFTKPLSDTVWPKGKGKWEIVNGAVRVAQVEADMHAAVKRHPLEFHNSVIQYQFKLDGAKATTLSLNGSKGHVCRVLINATGFSVKKDNDKKGKEKGAILDTVNVAVKPGVWHTMQVEIFDKEMLAQLDGQDIAYGSHPGIDMPLTSVGLTVGGETVSFKNLRVWDAVVNKDWPATRAKLLAARKK